MLLTAHAIFLAPFLIHLSILDVSNYNALRASSPDPATVPNPNYDEARYIEVRSRLLRSLLVLF